MGHTPWYRRASWRIVAATLLGFGLIAAHTLAEALRGVSARGPSQHRHGHVPVLLLSDLVAIAVLFGVAMWLAGNLRTRSTYRLVVLALAAVALPVLVWALPMEIANGAGLAGALILSFAMGLPIGALVAIPLLTAGVVRQIALHKATRPGVFLHLLLPALAGAAVGAVAMWPLHALPPMALGAMDAVGAATLSVTAALVAYLIDLGAGEQGRTFSSAAAPGTESTLP